MHYPGKYNNDNKPNDEIFKDKVVHNHPAGNIEFINTKDAESVSVTHKNGSHIKLDKNGVDELVTRDKREHVMGDSLEAVNGSKTVLIDENIETVVLGDIINKVGDVAKWREPMQRIKNEQRALHDKKRLFELKRTGRHNSIDQAPSQTKSGSHAQCPSDSNKSKVISAGSATKVSKQKVNSGEVMKVEDGQEEFKTVSGSGGTMCMTCWGKMLSPSTQDGRWATESEKAQIVAKREEIQKKIYEYEKQLGQNKCPNGGTTIQQIAKHFVQNIGLVFNDFESFRKDPAGKLVPYGVKIDPLGTTIYTQYRETSLVEVVDVEKFPGGSYNLNVCDGWTATVGSNGIEFKTTGPLNLFGTIVNLTGEQVSVGARSELNLQGERVVLEGDVITLSPRKLKRTLETGGETEEEQQVLVDGNLNVGLNAIVRGGMHVEGEFTVHHVTAPCEYHITETDFTYGTKTEPQKLPNPDPELCAYGLNGSSQTMDPEECGGEAVQKSPTYGTLLEGAHIGTAVGYDSNGQPLCLQVYSVKSENAVLVDQHVHYFKNLPMKLFDKDSQIQATNGVQSGSGSADPHAAVRAIGARNNYPVPVLSKPVKNSQTQHTVTTKFGGSGCETVTTNKADWEETSENDSLPNGEGPRSQKYPDETVREQVKRLEAELESKYNELKAALANISANNC